MKPRALRPQGPRRAQHTHPLPVLGQPVRRAVLVPAGVDGQGLGLHLALRLRHHPPIAGLAVHVSDHAAGAAAPAALQGDTRGHGIRAPLPPRCHSPERGPLPPGSMGCCCRGNHVLNNTFHSNDRMLLLGEKRTYRPQVVIWVPGPQRAPWGAPESISPDKRDKGRRSGDRQRAVRGTAMGPCFWIIFG